MTWRTEGNRTTRGCPCWTGFYATCYSYRRTRIQHKPSWCLLTHSAVRKAFCLYIIIWTSFVIKLCIVIYCCHLSRWRLIFLKKKKLVMACSVKLCSSSFYVSVCGLCSAGCESEWAALWLIDEAAWKDKALAKRQTDNQEGDITSTVFSAAAEDVWNSFSLHCSVGSVVQTHREQSCQPC